MMPTTTRAAPPREICTVSPSARWRGIVFGIMFVTYFGGVVFAGTSSSPTPSSSPSADRCVPVEDHRPAGASPSSSSTFAPASVDGKGRVRGSLGPNNKARAAAPETTKSRASAAVGVGRATSAERFEDRGVDVQSWWEEEHDEAEDDEKYASSTRSSSSTPHSDEDDEGFDDSIPSKRRRKGRRRWRSRNRDSSANANGESSSSSETPGRMAWGNDDVAADIRDQIDEEHPLRTDEWELDVRVPLWCPPSEADWFPQPTKEKSRRMRRRQIVRFARNGYVLVVEDKSATAMSEDAPSAGVSLGEDDGVDPSRSEAPREISPSRRAKMARVGKWRLGHSGVAFDVPASRLNDGGGKNKGVGVEEGVKRTVLHYRADIHLNKFGERPRMFRGIITRDRHSSFFPANFLRPVVGTFSAEGIGKDTADTMYKERGFGLSRQAAMQITATTNKKKREMRFCRRGGERES